MSHEEAPVASPLSVEQEASSAEASASSGIEPASPGRAACPLVMGGAGALAGALSWLVLGSTYPFFRVSEEILARIPLSFPPRELLEEFAAEQHWVNLQNAAVTGLLMGLLAAAVFALVQGAARGLQRSYIPMALCLLCGGAAGAVAGPVGQSVLVRMVSAAEPMTAAVVFQIVFWALLGGGLGAGTGMFLSPGRLPGLISQGILAGAVFGLLYVPLAAFAFPVDDAERLVPASPANRAIWAVAGMAVLGLLLGTASKTGRSR